MKKQGRYTALSYICKSLYANFIRHISGSISLERKIIFIRRLMPDEFRHFTTWLKNVVKPRMPEDFREKVVRILDASNPWEVERMIYNLELTLEEMQQQALLKGKREVAKNLLQLGIEIEKIARATGLTPAEISALKKQLEQ